MAASIINTNVMSLNAQRNLNKNALSLSTAVQRLSSGLRINSARDDAAGLAIAMGYEADVRALSVKIRNAADQISSNQTSDGQAAVVTDVLQRMSELSTQATNSTYTAAQKALVQVEYDALNTYQATLTGSTGSISGHPDLRHLRLCHRNRDRYRAGYRGHYPCRLWCRYRDSGVYRSDP